MSPIKKVNVYVETGAVIILGLIRRRSALGRPLPLSVGCKDRSTPLYRQSKSPFFCPLPQQKSPQTPSWACELFTKQKGVYSSSFLPQQQQQQGLIIFQMRAAKTAPTTGPTMNTHSCDSATPPSKRAGPIERAGFTDVPV